MHRIGLGIQKGTTLLLPTLALMKVISFSTSHYTNFCLGRCLRHRISALGTTCLSPAVSSATTVKPADCAFLSIAQMPGEKILFPDRREQESVLVEARSIAGYSGSPVFIYLSFFDRSRSLRHYKPNWGFGPWLLGVDHCHLSAFEPVRQRTSGHVVNEDWYVENNTGMMGVVPAWKLTEMFDMPEVKHIRF